MTRPQIDGPLSTHWRQQNRRSKAANEAKNKIERSRGIALLLTTIAAVLSTAAAQTGHWNAATAKVLAVLAAVALAPVLGREATHNAVVGAENSIHPGCSHPDHRGKEGWRRRGSSRLNRDRRLPRALRDGEVCCFDWPTSA